METDPTGRVPGEAGAKLDGGKVSVTRGALHYFPRAITEVAKLSQKGAEKYSWKGWQYVPDGVNRYSDALGRHELKIEGNFDAVDPDTGILEAACVAWNALARLELIIRERETCGKKPSTHDVGRGKCPVSARSDGLPF